MFQITHKWKYFHNNFFLLTNESTFSKELLFVSANSCSSFESSLCDMKTS